MRKRNYIKTGQGPRFTRRKALLFAAVILIMGYLATSLLLGDMGLVKYYRMNVQYEALADEIALLKRDNAKLRKTVYSLKNDPAYIERIARDKLGLARPGEIVYYYAEP